MSGLIALDIQRAADLQAPVLASTTNFQTALVSLSPQERDAIRSFSGVARARQAAFASCLGALAVKAMLRDFPVELDDLAVIVVGWRHHIPSTWQFAERALNEGPGLVNPMQFPYTLPSACATTIAATLHSHGPAFGVEPGDSSFVSALSQAKNLIDASFISTAAVVTVVDGSPFSTWEHAPWENWMIGVYGAFAAFVSERNMSFDKLVLQAATIDQFLGAGTEGAWNRNHQF